LAIADYNSALRLTPRLPTALYGRGFAKIKAGNSKSGNADFVAAKNLDQNIETEFTSYGLH
jgi:hypothetical protein